LKKVFINKCLLDDGMNILCDWPTKEDMILMSRRDFTLEYMIVGIGQNKRILVRRKKQKSPSLKATEACHLAKSRFCCWEKNIGNR